MSFVPKSVGGTEPYFPSFTPSDILSNICLDCAALAAEIGIPTNTAPDCLSPCGITGPLGILPAIKPGTLSWNIAVIKPLYLSVVSVGITASPGESIAGTTSPAPFGPGTDIIPSLYFLVVGIFATALFAPPIPPANSAGF